MLRYVCNASFCQGGTQYGKQPVNFGTAAQDDICMAHAWFHIAFMHRQNMVCILLRGHLLCSSTVLDITLYAPGATHAAVRQTLPSLPTMTARSPG